ncbi:transmembrane anchor protein (plasmid) [Roseomonas sp. OT10]|uniref:transmembrane anchor protein n=1 Tax=Roseomonas cutis TaxID=2897332 RepID=UPI001E5B325E|nr:transmembrane anchor protein [Roseomonas sp. OT10]UFN51702.1 transmembrane anchor protein [Roseomonas sp. OT10]
MYNTDLPTRAELPTSKQLLRSTGIAAAVATGLLVTVVLPSEYGIDPTGAGRVLGLTEMGEIKAQLAAEAEADRRTATPPAPASAPSDADQRSGLIGAFGTFAARFLVSPAAAQPAPQAGRSDTTTVTLRPNQGIEVKLTMREGARATYEWSSTGPVNYDLHGEPPGGSGRSYKAGRSVTEDRGELVAGFTGTHGWFWRNRSGGEVTVTLRTSGAYTAITRP